MRVLFIERDKKARYKKVKGKKNYVDYHNGLYILDEKCINTAELDGKILDSEIIFFVGNPNPLHYEEVKDKSGKFFDNMIVENALRQTGKLPTFNFTGIIDSVGGLFSLKNIIGFIIIGGVIAQLMGWGG